MPKVIASCKALIVHNGKFLLIKEVLHKKDFWDLPGGKIEYGESPEETLHREIFEELGIKVQILRSIGIYYFFSSNHLHQVICSTFLCKPTGSPAIDLKHNPAEEEIVEYLWLTKNELSQNKLVHLPESLQKLISKSI